jgi:hypothetical protein
VEPGTALLLHILIVVLLLFGAVLKRRLVLFAALPLLDAALLAVYVFGEDTYRRGGITRWEAYRSPGGALGPLFVGCLIFSVACAALLAYAALRDRRRVFRVTAALAAAAGVFVIIPTIIGFGAN